MNEDAISIESFEALKAKMAAMEFYVDWRVTSGIGPDWIGSYRTLNFYLDDSTLRETEFIKELKDKLIRLIPIPAASKHHVITGQGDISLHRNQLEICYDWDAAIPYQDPDESKEGKVFFYP